MIGSLFSGVGGLDLAAESLGLGPVAWHVENDPDASRVLAARWPGVPNLGDVQAVDWGAVQPVDVLTAGFPCTDISQAGKRAGIEEGRRSGLWREVVRAVRDLGPRLLLVENVAALLVRGLDRVLADLAALGWDAEWCCLRASDLGPCHRRDRLFLVGWPADATERGSLRPQPVRQPWGDGALVTGRYLPMPAIRDGERVAQPGDAASRRARDHRPHLDEVIAELRLLPTPRATDGEKGGPGQCDRRGVPMLASVAVRADGGWGPYGAAIARHKRWLGRPAPSPVTVGKRGATVLAPAFVAWMMALPADDWTDVGISRTAQLRCLGNAVVPAQAAAAYVHLLDCAGLAERVA